MINNNTGFTTVMEVPCYTETLIRKHGTPLGNDKTCKQANRGDKPEIYVTRQFFEDSGPQGIYFEKSVFI